MSREWKPGDVAMVTWDENVSSEVVYRFLGGAGFDIPEWQSAKDGCAYPRPDQLRPLVVIDPEDREQVERLADAYIATWVSGSRSGESARDICVRQMQSTLREFANPQPPKPEEPTGLGAVVEAINENFFVRIDLGTKAWRRQGDIDPAWTCEWSDIAVVRVLSEGVQA